MLEQNGGWFTPENVTALQEPFKKKNLFDKVFNSKDQEYFTNPTEIHARMREAQAYYGLTPGQEFTEEMYEDMRKKKNWFGLKPYLKDKKGFINLINKYAVNEPSSKNMDMAKYGDTIKMQTGGLLDKFSKNKEQVVNQLSNLPIYSPDARYSEYKGNVEDWKKNLEGVRVEENPNLSDVTGFDTPGSYFDKSMPSPLKEYPYAGTVQLDPNKFNEIDTRERVLGHELTHGAFDGSNFIPNWYADNLKNTARNPEGKDHKDRLSERAAQTMGVRRDIVNKYGLKPDAKIPRDLYDSYLRDHMNTDIRTNTRTESGELKESLFSARNASDLHNLLNMENVPKQKNGGWLEKYTPQAQTGYTFPSYQMPINKTDTPGGISIQEKQKQDAIAEEIHRRNVATNKRQFVGQGKASTPASEAKRTMLNKQYASQQPNAQIDEQGNVSTINPNMTAEGQPRNFMGERQQKGYEHVMGALEAASYIVPAIDLAGAGYGALRNVLGKSAGKAATEGLADVFWNGKSYQPNPTSTSSSLENIVQSTNQPWAAQELPGLHLKSTMSDGAISKIVEPKTGLVNVDQALSIIGKESGGAQKADIIRQALGENIPKKMDFNDFRKTVQDQLIPLDRQFVDHSSNYGLDKIGYPSPKKISFKNDLNELPIENQTLILSNKNKFGRGSGAHRNPDETLGHIHFLRDAETPDVLTVTQMQSDAFQGTNRTMPKSIDDAVSKLNKAKDDVKYTQETFGDEADKFQDVFDVANKHLSLEEATVKNFSQKSLLDKNHQERYIQELVNYAGERGDVNKIRLPTSETAAKIQNYEYKSADEITTRLKELKDLNPDRYDKIYNEQKKFFDDVTAGKIKGTYGPDAETILKKYSEQPKLIKKLYGVEPKIVTDAKGNSWYEFDIPETFKGGKGEIKAFKKGGVIEDDMGQWAHPGKITKINSNQITMRGVPYPVLGISDSGDQQMMYPGEEYKFKGKKVTEYPMAQKGINKPIYTNDPKKIKAYNDSLNLYKAYQMQDKLMGPGSKVIHNNVIPEEWSKKELKDNRVKVYNKNLKGSYAKDWASEKDMRAAFRPNEEKASFDLIKYYKSLGFTDNDIMYHTSPDIVNDKIRPTGTYWDGQFNSPIYKKPVQPYILQQQSKPKQNYWTEKDIPTDAWKTFIKKYPGAIGMDPNHVDKNNQHVPIYPSKPQPTLHPSVLNVKTIPTQQPINTPGIRQAPHFDMQLSPIEMGNYMVGYTDDSGQGVDRGFVTPEQRDVFVKELENRNLSSVQPYRGNITEYQKLPKKKNGGWLDKYK